MLLPTVYPIPSFTTCASPDKRQADDKDTLQDTDCTSQNFTEETIQTQILLTRVEEKIRYFQNTSFTKVILKTEVTCIIIINSCQDFCLFSF